ncbi:MAG: acyl carrier protein [Anaerovoracaceae bacterium]|jgi:acyl carrier protein
MIEIVREIVYEVTGKSNLTYDTDFVKDLELNSFDVMNIIAIFEERFDIDIPARDIWPLHQVRDVIEYMRIRGVQ